MTSKQNTFMFLKAGPYNGSSDDLYYEIVRYCQILDKPFLKKKMKMKMALSFTPARISFVHSYILLNTPFAI